VSSAGLLQRVVRRRMVCNSAAVAQLIYSMIAAAPGGCYLSWRGD
jgi:hypothetical protein